MLRRNGLRCMAMFIAALCFTAPLPVASSPSCPAPTTNITGSGDITVADVQCAILTVLAVSIKKLPVSCLKTTADIDCSGSTTVADVLLVIQAALLAPWSDALDEDGDGCLDSCQFGCCTPQGTPGCADLDCQDCVCLKDPYCCVVGWDSVCAEERSRTCMTQCGCLPMDIIDCCSAHGTSGCSNVDCRKCVATLKAPFCTEYYWDEICLLYAATCPVCGCAPPKEDCCEPHFGLGCDNPSCESCVCGSDDFCCTVIWDEHCGVLTRTKCPEVCNCTPLPPKGSCCAMSGVPGCVEPSCESCVCATDLLCCESRWDGPCLQRVYTQCTEQCSCYSTEGTGDCCKAHDEKGCGQAECSDCVCKQDPFCCLIGWFESCAIRAKQTCTEVCSCGAGP